MIQTNLNATIWAQNDTSKILSKRSRVATFNPAEVLHEAHGNIVYFGNPKLLCIELALSRYRCSSTLTAYADSWPASKWSVALDTERLVGLRQTLCIDTYPAWTKIFPSLWSEFFCILSINLLTTVC